MHLTVTPDLKIFCDLQSLAIRTHLEKIYDKVWVLREKTQPVTGYPSRLQASHLVSLIGEIHHHGNPPERALVSTGG
jgi:hypothetical protein